MPIRTVLNPGVLHSTLGVVGDYTIVQRIRLSWRDWFRVATMPTTTILERSNITGGTYKCLRL